MTGLQSGTKAIFIAVTLGSDPTHRKRKQQKGSNRAVRLQKIIESICSTYEIAKYVECR